MLTMPSVPDLLLDRGVATKNPPLEGWYRVCVRWGVAPTSTTVCGAQE